MTDSQARVEVLAAVRKRNKARHKFMLEGAMQIIADLPAVQPMQHPSAKVFWLDIVTLRR